MRLTVVLWKHYLIRKRHYLLTLAEICIPFLLFLLLAFCRAKVEIISKINVPAEIYTNKDLQAIETSETKIYYAPVNNDTENIIEMVKETFEMPSSNVLSFATEEEMIKHHMRSNHTRIIGIVFNNISKNFDYTLRYYLKFMPWMNDRLYYGGFSELESNYWSSGFLTVQYALDKAFIEKNSKSPLNVQLLTKGIAFPPRVKDVGLSQIYRDFLPLITIISFMFIIPAVVQRIVEEKRSGIKELQKMVGLESWLIWVGWFVHGLVPVIISNIIITVLMKVPFWGTEYPPIELTNGIIYFIFLMLYCISTICFCFVISTISSKPTSAMLIGMLLWIFSYFIPEKILEAYGDNIYLKLLFSIFPNIVLGQGYKIIEKFETKEVGLQWYNLFNKPLNEKNEICMFAVLTLFIIETLIFVVLAVYFDNINPGEYGIRKQFSYPFQNLKQWITSKSSSVGVNSHKAEEGQLVPRASVHGHNKRPGIILENLTKMFGGHPAVDNLNLNIDRDQITVLLGHNGAGKTTVMHMMTGMIDATKGHIYINDLNVKTHMKEIRLSLGLCPQHNLLFRDFTVEEHLIFFAMLKGMSYQSSKSQASVLMKKLNIDDKRNEMTRKLSGGMKRKLCLAMAIIGNPKVLILDEPTSGMDPESRREIWNMLKEDRESKTILITTHFLEEADVLGDKIAIMSHGKVLCHDTPHELKRKYKTGYNLSLSLKSKNDDERNGIQAKLTKILNEMEMNIVQLPAYGNKITLNLRIEDKNRFPELLNKLDKKKDELQIEGQSLTLTKLEDVYLKSMDTDETDEANHTTLDKNYDISVKFGKKMFFLPMIFKRFYCLRRKWLQYITMICLLSLLLIGITSLCQRSLFGDLSQHENKLQLNLKMYGEGTVFYHYRENPILQNISGTYDRLIKEGGSHPKPTPNVDDAAIRLGTSDIDYYKQHLVVGAEFYNPSTMIALYSLNALHSAPVSVNLITNALAKTMLGDDYSISVSSWPMAPLVVEDESEMLNETQSKIIWSFLFPLGIILFLCPFLTFPFEEMIMQFTRIQFMSGIPPWKYWLSSWFTDTIIILVAMIPICLIQLFQLGFEFNIFYHGRVFGMFFLLIWFLSVTSLPYAYLFSRRKTLSAGVALFIILNLFMGVILFTIVSLLTLATSKFWKDMSDTLDKVFLIMCPPYGYTKLSHFYSQQTTRLYNWEVMSSAEKRLECLRNENNPCCANLGKFVCDEYLSYFGPETSITLDITLIIVGMVVYWAINVFLDTLFQRIMERIKLQIFNLSKDGSCPDATDAPSCIEPKDVTFKAEKLQKKLGNKMIVNINDLKVKKGTCLGFLGVNGAGKTTTFRLITREMLNDHPNGKILIGDTDNKCGDAYLQRLGYCPQADLLNMTLTAKELLTCMAYIRGVKDVSKTVDSFIKIFDLEEYANKPIETYSGGNKRKVCAAASFIGIRDVVLLDEPTSGVDPKSRRNFWEVLKNCQFKNGLTTILTSHSMDECEALCDELAILKKGTIRKKATIGKLKKEINGYIVTFNLKHKTYDEVDSASSPATNDVSDSLAEKLITEIANFGQGKLRDNHHDTLEFHVTVKDNWTLGKIYERIESIKSKYDEEIEDYTINEVSVEDVFLNVAREQDDPV
ncbi:phospholipid-transporting ATPase ABCA3 isoform X2 [Aethina tumida]|nr:phospholipid-transporting ATPase ABCA3 isoform X2 [Aethina tumida]